MLQDTRARCGTAPGYKNISKLGPEERKDSVVGVYESFLDLSALLAGDGDEDDLFSDEERVSLQTPSPAMSRTDKRGANVRHAFFLFLKSFIGGAVLALPSAFYNGGVMATSVTVLATSVWNFYCMFLLYQSGLRNNIYTLGGLASTVGRPLTIACEVSLVVTQCSFCVTYFIFFTDCFATAMKWLLHCNAPDLTAYIYLGQIMIFSPVCLVRKLDKLAVPAIIADILIITCVFYLLSSYIWYIETDGTGEHVPWMTGSAVGSAMGTSIFAFEGVGMVLPVAGCMESPSLFPRVLLPVGVLLSLLYIAVGGLGVLAYGNQTSTTALLNLSTSEPNSPMPVVVQLFWCISLLVTFPIQIAPAFTSVERVFVLSRSCSDVFRVSIVVVLGALSFLFRNSFSQFIALSGVFCCLPLAFIYPPIIHLYVAAGTPKEIALDVGLLILGAVVC